MSDKYFVKIVRGSDIEPRPRPKCGVTRIALSDEPVALRGEPLDEIWWRGKQWAVTAYGIECLDGTYFIERSRLLEEPEYPWPPHMAEKIWVDIDEFTAAWLVAIVPHGHGRKATARFIRQRALPNYQRPGHHHPMWSSATPVRQTMPSIADLDWLTRSFVQHVGRDQVNNLLWHAKTRLALVRKCRYLDQNPIA